MRGSVRLQLLAEFERMATTGRQRHPDGERPIGAALARRLPRIIDWLAAREMRCAARTGSERGRG